MKKRSAFILLTLLLMGCQNTSSQDDFSKIPEKINPIGVGIEDSSITTKNIDNYLFRDDVIYVDLRSYSEIMNDGHIAGFSFYPFYDFIATIEGVKDYNDQPMDNRLFKMKKETGQIGQVGNFVPNYTQSEKILYELFPKDKYIFTITISNNENMYFLNLLKQYGYDSSKLYNIGGFSMNTGLENVAYKNIDNPKYLVSGNPLVSTTNQIVTFDFMKELTPIVDKEKLIIKLNATNKSL